MSIDSPTPRIPGPTPFTPQNGGSQTPDQVVTPASNDVSNPTTLAAISAPALSPSPPTLSSRLVSILSNTTSMIPYNFFSSPTANVAESQTTKFAQALKGKTANEIKSLLNEVYGERLSQKAWNNYKLNDKQTLSSHDIKCLQVSLATEVTTQDLKHFYQSLLPADSRQRFMENFSHYFADDLIIDLEALIPTSGDVFDDSFNKLQDNQIHLLLKFFRHEAYGSQSSRMITLSPTEKDVVQSIFPADIKRLQALTDWQDFTNEHSETHYDHLAATEFLSRRIGYASLEEGFILPVPCQKDKPVFYEVKTVIDKEGFAFCLLQGLTANRQGELQAVFRGTNPSDMQSVAHNLAEASGLDVFEAKHEQTILQAINECCQELVERGLTPRLAIQGHSQGGALSQHLVHSMVSQMANKLDTPEAFPLHTLRGINVITWCSPRALEEQAERFAENAAKLMTSYKTRYCPLSFEENRVKGDTVHTLGGVYIACMAHSDNVSRSQHSFEPTKAGYLGAHCNPILNGNANPTLADVDDIKDDRTSLMLLSNQIDALDHFIRLKEISSEIETTLPGLVIHTLEQTLGHIKLEEISEHEAEIARSAHELNLEEEQIKKLIGLLNLQKHLQASDQYINAFLRTQPDWAAELNNATLTELKNARDQLDEDYRAQLEVSVENAKNMCAKMSDTTFKSLTAADQFVTSYVLSFTKGHLANLINPSVPISQKASSAVQLTAAGVGASLGLATVASTGPVTLALAAAGTGLGMRLRGYFTSNRS